MTAPLRRQCGDGGEDPNLRRTVACNALSFSLVRR